MKLDLGLNESEEMLKKTGLDFMRRDAPKEVVEALQETNTGYTEYLWCKAVETVGLGSLFQNAMVGRVIR